MKGLNGCPFCGAKPITSFEVNENIGVVFATAKCPWCGCERTAVALIEDGDTLKAKHKALDELPDVWNIRKKEPRKESNIEWALNEIKKGYFYFNTCKIANCIKNGKPCGECDECDECEFQYNEDAVAYLLAPHEDSSYD